MAEYGERFQESVVHMLEHFAFPTAPVVPIQGQIWFKNAAPLELFVYDGAGTGGPNADGWLQIALTVLTGDLDMGGFNIVNLGAPADPSDDAVSVNFANATYLRLDATNDPMSAALELFPNGAFPQANSNIAATITYVNSMTLDGLADVIITAPTTESFLRFDGVDWIDSLIVLNDLGDVDTVTIPPAPGEVLTFDGVDWVPAAPAAGTDRFLQSGIMNGSTLELTVDTSPSTLPVVVSVTNIAPIGHTHVTQAVYHDENPQTFDSSYIRDARVSTVASPNPAFPQNDAFNNVVDAIDQALYVTRNPYKRRILQGDGAATAFGPGTDFPEYVTYSNKLIVYLNGVKQYASSRGTASLLFDTPSTNSASDTVLSIADYAIDAVVPGISGTGNFQIVGDVTLIFTTGTQFSVLGSSGNDSVWVVTTSTFVGPNTEIEVTETIVDGTADGIISVVDVDDYEFDIAVDAVDFPPGTTSTTVTVRPAPLEVNLIIANVDIALDTFDVVGDYESVFSAGRIFVVENSTGNDGQWTVASSVFASGTGITTITVTPGDITDATIDGIIAVTYVSFAGLTEELQIVLDTALANDVTTVFRDSAILFIPDSQGNTSTVALVNTTGAGTDLFNTLAATYADSEVLYDSYGSEVAITTIDDVNDEFDVTGDYTAAFPTGARFIVQGTTGFVFGFPQTHGVDDGVFEVAAPGATFGGGVTTIPVTSDLVAGAGGIIFFSRTLAYEENGVPLSNAQVDVGDAIDFTVAPSAGDLIETNVVP
jgi:hypothetical protein